MSAFNAYEAAKQSLSSRQGTPYGQGGFSNLMGMATNQGRYSAPSGYQGNVGGSYGATISPYGGGMQPSIQFSPGMEVVTGRGTPGIQFGPNTSVATARSGPIGFGSSQGNPLQAFSNMGGFGAPSGGYQAGGMMGGMNPMFGAPNPQAYFGGRNPTISSLPFGGPSMNPMGPSMSSGTSRMPTMGFAPRYF